MVLASLNTHLRFTTRRLHAEVWHNESKRRCFQAMLAALLALTGSRFEYRNRRSMQTQRDRTFVCPSVNLPHCAASLSLRDLLCPRGPSSKSHTLSHEAHYSPPVPSQRSTKLRCASSPSHHLIESARDQIRSHGGESRGDWA